MNLTLPRASTIALLALVLALLTATPVPLAVAVTVVAWAFHTPAALVAGIALVLAYRITHPKGAR